MMARTLRIDGIQVLPSGQVNVNYTDGIPPLPVAASGDSVTFASLQDMADSFKNLETDMPKETLIGLQIAKLYKTDTSLHTLSTLAGKTASIDTTGTATVLSIG